LDPVGLTLENWEATRVSLALLAALALCGLISGSSFILAHAIIPSAIGTGFFKTTARLWLANTVRTGAYATGAAALLGVIVFLIWFIVSLTGWLGDVYPNYWQ